MQNQQTIVLTSRAIKNIFEKSSCIISEEFIGYIFQIFNIRKKVIMLVDLQGNFTFVDI